MFPCDGDAKVIEDCKVLVNVFFSGSVKLQLGQLGNYTYS